MQAERQAVNSQIQGSAADIAKKAMVNIEKRLTQVFPNRTNVLQKGGEAAHLVLQLHDELLYEVNPYYFAVLNTNIKKFVINWKQFLESTQLRTDIIILMRTYLNLISEASMYYLVSCNRGESTIVLSHISSKIVLEWQLRFSLNFVYYILIDLSLSL